MYSQYHVYNAKVSTAVTVPEHVDEEYVKNFAARCLVDFYQCTHEDVKGLRCELLCEFCMESIINLDVLKKEE